MQTAKTILLGHLDHDPVVMAMPGQVARLKQIDDLMASIPEQGLLQSLKVRVSPDAGLYYVTAGNRRLATLRALRDAGAEIRGEKVTDDWSVPVVVSTETDDSAREQAVAENVHRVALTPGAEARQYAELAQHGSTKDIAVRFGVPEKRVRQRLALAALHDDVLAALDAGKIPLAAAQAFTLEPDPDKQAEYLNTAKSWDLEPGAIKRNFTQQLVNGKSDVAKLIGLDAYLAAGGEVLGDAFDSGSWWISQDVIAKLRDAHWEEQAAAWLKDGWSFVMAAAEFGDGNQWTARYAPALDREEDAPFTVEQRAQSGVIYWADGDLEPRFGVLPKGTKATDARGGAEDAGPDLEMPGGSLNHDLRDAAAAAVAAHITAAPIIALQVLVATLHATAICGEEAYDMPIGIYGDEGGPEWEVDDDGAPVTGAAIPPQGRNFAEALAWAAQQPTDVLVAYLAERVVAAIDLSPAWRRSENSSKLALVDLLGSAVPFDATAFFGKVTKAYLQLAWRDMSGDKLKAKKGADVAALLAAKAVETGWLPPVLRTASYAGPALLDEDDDAPAADNDDAVDDVPAVAAE